MAMAVMDLSPKLDNASFGRLRFGFLVEGMLFQLQLLSYLPFSLGTVDGVSMDGMFHQHHIHQTQGIR